MNMRSFTSHLHTTASALALSAAATIGLAALYPAAAASISGEITGGGSTLASLAMRQIFDCYADVNLGGVLPSVCTTQVAPVEGFYGAVGSGSGLRAFIANSPKNLLLSGTSGLNIPAIPPPFVDPATFPSYPYPHLDFGASDSPLPIPTTTVTGSTLANFLTTVSNSFTTGFTNWQTFTAGQVITTIGSATVTYSTAKYGQPVQLPAFEVPVAVAINVAAPVTTTVHWQIKSGLTPNTQAGGAVQLTGAQLCAIFSAEVKDWSAVTNISSINNLGAKLSEPFDNANSGNASGHVTPVPYVTGGLLPMTVVYRSDGSGTSFILTNYLANYCPLLDNGTNNYKNIFTTKLPGTKFSQLTANIKTFTGVDVTAPTYNGNHPWLGFSGTANVAANISTGSAQAGEIGYVSADFTEPYAKTVTGIVGTTTVTVPAPLSASVLNDQLRSCGVYHPGDTPLAGACQTALGNHPQNLIAPTPGNANNAWKSLNTPKTTWTWVDWNVYGQIWPTGKVLPGGGAVSIATLSILPLAESQGAYPISGTTFLELYSCYNDTANKRVPEIRAFLNWYLHPSNALTTAIQNNGFDTLPATYSTALYNEYVNTAPLTANTITARQSGAVNGCTGVVTGGGAN
jgi:ABC-type phosphate transport system substrate-binding protein